MRLAASTAFRLKGWSGGAKEPHFSSNSAARAWRGARLTRGAPTAAASRERRWIFMVFLRRDGGERALPGMRDESQESCGDPGHGGYKQKPGEECPQVGPHRTHCIRWRNLADRTGDEVADAQGRSEHADPHGKDDDHRVLHFVDPQAAGD